MYVYSYVSRLLSTGALPSVSKLLKANCAGKKDDFMGSLGEVQGGEVPKASVGEH